MGSCVSFQNVSFRVSFRFGFVSVSFRFRVGFLSRASIGKGQHVIRDIKDVKDDWRFSDEYIFFTDEYIIH